MLRLRTGLGAVALLLTVGASAQTTDLWIGDFPDDNASTATNWVGGVVPPNIDDGTDLLLMSSNSATSLNADTVMSFTGLYLEQQAGGDGNFTITGSSPITIGGGGITLTSFDDGYAVLAISAPLTLSGTQTWTGGNITVNSLVQGTGLLILSNGFDYTFNNGSNTYTGGISVGPYSSVILGASSHALGYGSVDVSDGGGIFVNAGSSISVANGVQIGDGSNGASTYFGAFTEDDTTFSKLTFSSGVILQPYGDDTPTQSISVTNGSELVFASSVAGTGGETLTLAAPNSTVSAITVFQGSISGIQELNVTNLSSVIFDGSSVAQLTGSGITAIETATTRTDIYNGSYVGFGANYSGNIATALSTFLPNSEVQGNFKGTLGLDTTSGAAATFTDSIDLTNFSNPYFIGLGSATQAILSGTIIPVGGLSDSEATNYQFGGGGGTLTVTSGLADSTYAGNPHNGLILKPGNAPLTLILSGTDTYHGTTLVDGGALVFDSPFTTTLFQVGEHSSVFGYVGNTENSAILDTAPQSFIGFFDSASAGVAGFDNFSSTRTVTGPISLIGYGGLYLGTASNVTFAGTITPSDDSTYKFSGVKGGAVTVSSLLSGGNSLEVGLPTPIESFGSVSSVTLTNTSNSLSGGITLNSGYLYLANGAEGSTTATLNIVGPPDDGTGTVVGIRPYGGALTLNNPVTVPYEGAHINAPSSSYTVTLAGPISNYELDGQLIIDGPTVITNGSNTYSGGTTVNGTTLTVSSDGGLGSGNLTALAGSVVTMSSEEPTLNRVELNSSTLGFTYVAGSPTISNLIMEAGSTLNFVSHSDPIILGMQSDTAGSGNVIHLGQDVDLQFQLNSDPDFHGTITGNVDSGIDLESGTLNLYGANTYGSGSGYTIVNSGALLIASNSSALGTSEVQVSGTLAVNVGVTLTNNLSLSDGGTIAGYGTVSPGGTVIFQNGSTVIPGSANLGASNLLLPPAGTLTFGAGTSVTFGNGGFYNFAVTDANGGAGVGYSTLNISGTLTISATETPFTINLYSFAANNNAVGVNPVSNFSASSPYSWVLATAGSGISGYNLSDFQINTGNFLNSLGSGNFTIVQEDNQLLLNFDPVPEPGTVVLVMVGTLGIAAVAWRRRKTA